MGLLCAGCDGGPGLWNGDGRPGPGTEAWGRSDLSCDGDHHCNAGEGCYQGMCQPRQCRDSERPARSPFGPVQELVSDLELAVIAGSELRFLAPGALLTDLELAGTDNTVAAVDLIAGRPDTSGTPAVAVVTPLRAIWRFADGRRDERDLPASAAVATSGDLDADGIDDLVFSTQDGELWACTSGEDGCALIAERGERPSALAIGFAGEGVRIFAAGDALEIISPTGEVQFTPLDDADALVAIDLDGDARDEVIALHPGTWPWDDSRLIVYRFEGGTLAEVASAEVGNAIDLAAGDLDADGAVELVVLQSGGAAEILVTEGLTLSSQGSAAVGASAERIALWDVDDDSARAELVAGPELVTGEPIPMVVATFSPYHRDHSEGTSALSLGEFEFGSETISAGVRMSLAVEVGVSVGAESVVQSRFKTRLSRAVEASRAIGSSYSVGSWIKAKAQPELFGDDYAAVLLGYGCYDKYTYRLRDSEGRAAGIDGEEMVALIPVGGESSVWSSTRYNQLAELRGDLPVIEIHTRIGDLSSYPSVPMTLDGHPVAEADHLFSSRPSFRVSDTATIGWTASVSDSEKTSEARSVSVGATVTAKGFGVSIGLNATSKQSLKRTLTVGSGTMLRGRTPPILDDPRTPEDEYSAFAFSFSPVLYRHGYTRHTGEEAWLYAVTHTVSR